MTDDRDRPTNVPCPVHGCEGGLVVARSDLRYSAIRCSYCAGTGIVTVERHHAYVVLQRYGTIPHPT